MESVSREQVFKVLDRFAKNRPTLRIIHNPHSPEEVFIIDSDFSYFLEFPEDMDVPERRLHLLSAITGIPVNLFTNPNWMDL